MQNSICINTAIASVCVDVTARSTAVLFISIGIAIAATGLVMLSTIKADY